jgi:hypothetical protein
MQPMNNDRDQFEVGDEPIDVERRPRAGAVVSIRLSPEEADQLQELAAERNTTLSRLGREAIVRLLQGGHEPVRVSAVFMSWTAMSTYPGNLKLSSDAPIVMTSGNARELSRKS